MTSISDRELWVDSRRATAVNVLRGRASVRYVMHQVGEGDEIVAQLSVGDAVFWVTAASPELGPAESVRAGRAAPAAVCCWSSTTHYAVLDQSLRARGSRALTGAGRVWLSA